MIFRRSVEILEANGTPRVPQNSGSPQEELSPELMNGLDAARRHQTSRDVAAKEPPLISSEPKCFLGRSWVG